MIVNRIGYGTEIQEVEDLTVAQQASSQQISSADETSREASQITVSVEGYDSEISDANTSISNITTNINTQTDIILGYSSEISSLKSQMAGLSVSNFFSNVWSGIKGFFGFGNDDAQKKAQDKYNAKKADIQSQIDALEVKQSSAKSVKEKYENEKSSLQDKVKTLESQKKDAQARLDELQRQAVARELERQKALQDQAAKQKESANAPQNGSQATGAEKPDEKAVEKQVLSDMEAQIESLQAEYDAAESSKGIGGFISGLFGGGTKKLKKELNAKKEALEKAKNDSTKLAESYLAITGSELTPEKLAAAEESVAVSNLLTTDQKSEIVKSLQEQASSMDDALKETVDGQGCISWLIGKANNVVDIGSTEKDSKAKIKAYQEMVANLDPESEDFAAQYKAITGEDFTVSSVSSLMDKGDSKVKNSFASESIYDFEATQKTALDAVVGTISGMASVAVVTLCSAAGIVAAPFTAGASLSMIAGGLALSGTVGALVNVGLKGLDGATSDKGYSWSQAGKDALSGAINGVVGVFTGGAGSAITKNISVAAAKSTLTGTTSSWFTRTAVNAGTKMLGETVEGTMDGALGSASSYLLDVATDKDKKFSFGEFAQTTLMGGAFGGLTGAGMSASSQVVSGSFNAFKSYFPNMALNPKNFKGADFNAPGGQTIEFNPSNLSGEIDGVKTNAYSPSSGTGRKMTASHLEYLDSICEKNPNFLDQRQGMVSAEDIDYIRHAQFKYTDPTTTTVMNVLLDQSNFSGADINSVGFIVSKSGMSVNEAFDNLNNGKIQALMPALDLMDSSDISKVLKSNNFETSLADALRPELGKYADAIDVVGVQKAIDLYNKNDSSWLYNMGLENFDSLNSKLNGKASPELTQTVAAFEKATGLKLHADNNCSPDDVMNLINNLNNMRSSGRLQPGNVYLTNMMPENAGGGYNNLYPDTIAVRPMSMGASHSIDHEYTHLVDFNSKIALYRNLPLPGELSQDVSSLVSRYATSNTDEMIAEVGALMLKGDVKVQLNNGKLDFYIREGYKTHDGLAVKLTPEKMESWKNVLNYYFTAGGISYQNAVDLSSNYVGSSISSFDYSYVDYFTKRRAS